MVDCEHSAKTVKPPRKQRTHFRIMLPDKLPRAAGRTLLRGGSGALRLTRLPESLPKQAIGSGSNTLAGGARGRRSVERTPFDLTRPSRGAPHTLECFKVDREDGPYRTHLGPI
jgi:hypothetical protein